MRMEREIHFIRNNIDHYTGATFGCHENYLVRRAAPLTEANVHSLLAFLTLRMLYVSAGRVGRDAGGRSARRIDAARRRKAFSRSASAPITSTTTFSNGCSSTAPSSTPATNRWPTPANTAACTCCTATPTSCPPACSSKSAPPRWCWICWRLNCLPKIALADAVAAFRTLVPPARRPVAGAAGRRPLRRRRGLAPRSISRPPSAELRGRDAETDQLVVHLGRNAGRAGHRPGDIGGQGGLDHQALAAAPILRAGRTSPGAIPGSNRRTWNIIKSIRRAVWAWPWPALRPPGKFRPRKSLRPPARPPANTRAAVRSRSHAPAQGRALRLLY